MARVLKSNVFNKMFSVSSYRQMPGKHSIVMDILFYYLLSKYASVQYDWPIFTVGTKGQMQNLVFALRELTVVEEKVLNKYTDKYRS